MKIIFCSTERTQGDFDPLEKIIRDAAPAGTLWRCRTIGDLSAMLRSLDERIGIAVLVAATMAELEAYLSIKDLLENIRIILIVPNNEPETSSKGHRLQPRFIANIDSDLTTIGAVMERMVAMERDQEEV